MTLGWELEERGRYLLVTLTGVLGSVDDVAAVAGRVVSAVRESGCVRVLQDERGMEVTMDGYDTLFAADRVDTFAPGSGVRVASLRSPANWEIGLVTETFLRSRSLNFRVFGGVDEALAWLLE